MRQAIDEGFILDVLKGYVPYKTAFNLGKEMDDEKRVDAKPQTCSPRRMALHPTNVTQKVRFIMEHFSKNVAHRLDGKAKAMVVTTRAPLRCATRRLSMPSSMLIRYRKYAFW